MSKDTITDTCQRSSLDTEDISDVPLNITLSGISNCQVFAYRTGTLPDKLEQIIKENSILPLETRAIVILRMFNEYLEGRGEKPVSKGKKGSAFIVIYTGNSRIANQPFIILRICGGAEVLLRYYPEWDQTGENTRMVLSGENINLAKCGISSL